MHDNEMDINGISIRKKFTSLESFDLLFPKNFNLRNFENFSSNY